MAATPASPNSSSPCLPGSSRVFGYNDAMICRSIRYASIFSVLALPLLAPNARGVPPSVVTDARAAPVSWNEYLAARAAFKAEADGYWTSIAEKRRGRNAKRRERQQITLEDYVLTQPPVYDGPPRPPGPPPEPVPESKPRVPKPIPVVSDLVAAASQVYQWTPQRPAKEMDFKRAYARYAVNAGLTPQQAIRVYAFETGGNGTHASQSGFRNGHAISTAIGYNQLLTTNTVELIAEQGDELLKALKARATALNGPARAAMEHKISVLTKMVALATSIPDEWAQHEKMGDTPQGWAMHAMVLDIDVGPMLQTYKLLTSVIFAREKGYKRPLTAAELEMMNLTGDGTGLDMVTMPQAMREQVPTSNFFVRLGYERNPVAVRNNTVARLLAVTDRWMDSHSELPGAKELAAAF
jgi:hypothetical protein